VESASAVSDAPSVAKPSVLRASKKLCVRGGVLSLMSAAGGASSALIGARLLLGRKAFPRTGSAAEGASERAPAGKESATGIFADVASVTPIAVEGTSVFAEVASTPDTVGALGSVAANKGSDFVGADVVFAALMPAAEAGAEATEVFAVEDAFAVEAGAVEFEAEAGVDADEARPRSSAAKADSPNSANSMAATATLTSLPLGVGANARALSN
jgi:hypothetical protein